MEVRYTYDPYTTVAGEDYDIGRDLEYVGQISYLFLGIAITFFIIVVGLKCWLRKKYQKDEAD